MDPSFLVILAVALGALWLMSNRTRKQQRTAAEFRNNLVAGDEVMTASGLLGTVVDVEDDADLEDELDDQNAVSDADRISRANDDVIDVPDDLSSLPPARKDGEPDTK